MKNLNYDKLNGLLPAIIQDAKTNVVLMLGFMNEAALEKTQQEGKVTFFSRTKNRLWTKGETSGNFLNVVDIRSDCDDDTLLIKVNPIGGVCHTGSDTCFNEINRDDAFLYELERIILDRKNNPDDESYTASLFKKGINKIAQKVGEEAVEIVIEAKDDNKDLFLNEAADLLYHLEVLLAAKDVKLQEVVEILRVRNNK
ncbi:MAG: phosphoribosyl-ATP pyrophosphohydrolase/phosphoribosyl-AMP cyclohydrolase [Cognaticolwellia sp.]|jgi:phosphoribosyl-ATP pyrophosphohydrolase/phosphoribosyl-AMP cyclohydrolase|tara:strand:- start:77 stop:673 length:597 start_codon:yes stop_codon:yes gene_type:complete